MKRHACAWITLAFFAVSIPGRWLFGWLALIDETHERRGGYVRIHAGPLYSG